MDTHNGWTNYETWATAHYLGLHEDRRKWQVAASDAWKASKGTPAERSTDARCALIRRLDDALEGSVSDLHGDPISCLCHDLLFHAFEAVDTRQIADAWLTDSTLCPEYIPVC